MTLAETLSYADFDATVADDAGAAEPVDNGDAVGVDANEKEIKSYTSRT